jgi:hypothetical protein
MACWDTCLTATARYVKRDLPKALTPSPTEFFRIPPDRGIELDAEVEI